MSGSRSYPSSKNKRGGPSRNKKTLSGIIKRHPDGFGFLIPDDSNEPDVYVPRKSMSGVMSNDRVRVIAEREPDNRWRGDVEEVLMRGTKRVSGQYQVLAPSKGLLADRSLAWGADLIVDNPQNIPVKAGDWITVDVKSYPDEAKGFRGEINKVLGDILDPLNDNARILHQHGIPEEFSKKAIAEAEQWGREVPEGELTTRRDLRSLPLITIDGRTAKDFDDAIFVESNREGFRLLVAIADVSHYVRPNTRLDDEAYERGTSTYFPNFVAPMIPKALSDHLCSLMPKVDRLCLVADMKFDFTGHRLDAEFYEAVMRSQARVTYGEAQEVIDGRTPDNLKHVEQVILRATDLAKIFMNGRSKRGALDLEIPETELEVDETGEPVDVMQAERLFSHKLIEEMMLAANVAVAEFLSEKQRPVLYRIHDEPDPDAIRNLESFMRTLGFQKRIAGSNLAKAITKALEEFEDHPKRHILHILALRSMAQAKYSPENIGHFGLAYENYTHFTSPIRRYPDLIVHRVLKSVVAGRKGYPLIGEAELATAGSFLSACEQRSVKAERHIRAIKKARFMHRYLGQEFDGFISSVAKFGVFVLLRQFDIDGLIRLEQLGGDRFTFDEQKLQLVGRKSGMTYAIGDPIRIQVAAVNIEEGQVDFILAEGEESNDRAKQKIPSTSPQRQTQNNHRDLRPTRLSKRRRKN